MLQTLDVFFCLYTYIDPNYPQCSGNREQARFNSGCCWWLKRVTTDCNHSFPAESLRIDVWCSSWLVSTPSCELPVWMYEKKTWWTSGMVQRKVYLPKHNRNCCSTLVIWMPPNSRMTFNTNSFRRISAKIRTADVKMVQDDRCSWISNT